MKHLKVIKWRKNDRLQILSGFIHGMGINGDYIGIEDIVLEIKDDDTIRKADKECLLFTANKYLHELFMLTQYTDEDRPEDWRDFVKT